MYLGINYYVDLLILGELEASSLLQALSTSRYFAKISPGELWKNLLQRDYPSVMKYLPGTKYRQYYQSVLHFSRDLDENKIEKNVNEYLYAHLIHTINYSSPRDGHTLLHRHLLNVVQKDHQIGYKIIIEQTKTSAQTLLGWAISEGSMDIVKAYWNEEDGPVEDELDGYLEEAIAGGKMKIVQWFSEHPRNWRSPDHYSVQHAVVGGNLELADWMVDQGYDFSIVDSANIYYGGVDGLEWYEEKGILPTEDTANEAFYNEGPGENHEVLTWMAERGIHYNPNL